MFPRQRRRGREEYLLGESLRRDMDKRGKSIFQHFGKQKRGAEGVGGAGRPGRKNKPSLVDCQEWSPKISPL